MTSYAVAATGLVIAVLLVAVSYVASTRHSKSSQSTNRSKSTNSQEDNNIEEPEETLPSQPENNAAKKSPLRQADPLHSVNEEEQPDNASIDSFLQLDQESVLSLYIEDSLTNNNGMMHQESLLGYNLQPTPSTPPRTNKEHHKIFCKQEAHQDSMEGTISILNKKVLSLVFLINNCWISFHRRNHTKHDPIIRLGRKGCQQPAGFQRVSTIVAHQQPHKYDHSPRHLFCASFQFVCLVRIRPSPCFGVARNGTGGRFVFVCSGAHPIHNPAQSQYPTSPAESCPADFLLFLDLQRFHSCWGGDEFASLCSNHLDASLFRIRAFCHRAHGSLFHMLWIETKPPIAVLGGRLFHGFFHRRSCH